MLLQGVATDETGVKQVRLGQLKTPGSEGMSTGMRSILCIIWTCCFKKTREQ